MNLRQLRFLCQVEDCGLNISKAALALHTSQPSVSRQILSLENELGVRVFNRSEKRLTSITRAGVEILRAARRIMRETDSLSRIGKDLGNESQGTLTIATSHTHARYSLPGVIQKFARIYPAVKLTLRQGDPSHIAMMVANGEADLLISASPAESVPGVAFIPCRSIPRVLITPKKHPLLKVSHVTLEELSKHSLITYDGTFTFHAQVLNAFRNEGLKPRIALTATDIDVMKTYVRGGFGIALLTALAYRTADRESLRSIDVSHLFGLSLLNLGLKESSYICSYVYRFIELFAPKLTREKIDGRVFGSQ